MHLLHFPAQLSLLIKRLIQINIISEIFMCFFSLHDWAHGNPLELFPHNGDIRSTFDSFNSFPISKTTCLPWYIGYQVICNRLLINCTNVNYLFIYLFFVKLTYLCQLCFFLFSFYFIIQFQNASLRRYIHLYNL